MKQFSKKRKRNVDSKDPPTQERGKEQAKDDKKLKNGMTTSFHVSLAAGKGTWSWDQYLKEQNAVAAPAQLFSRDQSFPEHENGFQIGMRLEGIDPQDPSKFFVLSVAEVCGYRLRLHFDGYLSCYDFWTNAGSPDIHPVGWCEKTKHELHVPKGYRKDKVACVDNLKTSKLQNAPKKLFLSRNVFGTTVEEFQVGMKLEAVDRKNPSLVCVATIADIVEDRLLVHFDNWDDSYDYWCDIYSPFIQPVGWCQKNGRTLIAPQGHPDPENFSWTDYLEVTHSSTVPVKAFKMRKPHGFLVNMKLEAVDKRNPSLIRVATIVDVEDQRIKVHFDGWSHKYDYWMDVDSPDIHPIGWCNMTGHPLEVPYRERDEKTIPGQAVCPTPGCRGVGHIRGPSYMGHHSAYGCPYSDINLKKETMLQHRLGKETQANFVSDSSQSKLKGLCSVNFNGKHEKLNSKLRLVQQAKCLKIKGKEDIDLDNLFREYSTESTEQALHQSVFLSAMSTHPSRDLPLCREQHCKLLPGVADIQASEVAKWTVDEVANFVQSLPGCEDHSRYFKKEQIDGKAFLLLTQTDIVKVMRIKLGPALKIYNSILMFRNAQDLEETDSASSKVIRE
ncbi:lethal(3)malignant brain tumor-like protein 4 isoform X1 [Monodelphis domestica]|uniref:L3MBTL histone methyl-lysine binding protein 4 n=1 Tax=Monodelphis domestica TaxID=13616 RepID=F7GLP9_MONDO|nr:lethal(3)malignant brain tumor-like protein 4 isoform X1 [Monodelphis domestica]XP_056679664.1 lethal(3)malignant brain tumor-like protein 4 isoform X1 [Monodelphis domestica]